MMNTMTKQKINELLSELNLNINDYYIFFDASLVIRGIKETCKYLSICTTQEIFESLKLKYNDIKSLDIDLYQLSNEIVVFVDDKENFMCEIVESYPLEDLDELLELKKQRDPERNKEDIMKIKKYFDNLKYEMSCGAYVIDNEKVLMVKHKTGNHWDFPKGHIEINETKEETAIREVKEETGIEINIVSNKEYKNTYKPKINVQKEVIFFEAEKVGGDLKIQEEEVTDVEWLDFTKAIERLTFEKSKDLFKKFLKDKKWNY